ncbi:hypothetical protein HY625_00220 [Candidatus Uhrbacteria bacterium]|nr:hypothetical protein [Candidatus Uhrbacteria bacterium]
MKGIFGEVVVGYAFAVLVSVQKIAVTTSSDVASIDGVCYGLAVLALVQNSGVESVRVTHSRVFERRSFVRFLEPKPDRAYA